MLCAVMALAAMSHTVHGDDVAKNVFADNQIQCYGMIEIGAARTDSAYLANIF